MINRIALIVLLPLVWTSCSPGYTRYVAGYQRNASPPLPDYGNLNHWAAHPVKADPSDSIPGPLRKTYMFDSTVDVFFLYPTSLTDGKDTRWNADINDAGINAKTDYSSILYQASVFNEYNVYAPRYRQAHYRSYFSEDTAAARAAFALAYADIRQAFQYYLAHYNQGRPIIIASHSQGTTHAIELIKEFFDNTALQNKLVAAYLVGMYIPGNAFTQLRVCTNATQVNCYCGWRTYEVNYIPPFVLKEKITSSVTNPLSWSTDTAWQKAELNQGAILRKFNKVYRKVSDARVNNGILWTHKPKFPGSFLLKTKNYHIGDINLYYYSIRNNVRQRVAVYKNQYHTIPNGK